MNAQRQAHGLTSSTLNMMMHAVAVTATSLKSALRLPTSKPARSTSERTLDAAALVEAEAVFVDALCEDSNLEIEWLWVASNVVRDSERRYCFERVLRINPDNQTARKALAQLPPIPAHLERMAGYL